MYSVLESGSLIGELVCVSVLSVVLAILLIYEHWQKRLEKKQRDRKELYVSDRFMKNM